MRFRLIVLLWVLSVPAVLGAEPLRFAVIGDSGTGGAGQKAIAHQMELYHRDHPLAFVLMLGDNIYESGQPAHFQSKFKQIYRDLHIPFHAFLGNHDRRTRKGMDQVADDAFGYVDNQDEYVFEAGPLVDGKRLARFIGLNSGAWRSGEEVARRQARLESWLAGSEGAHWSIVFFHHPLYSFAQESPFKMVTGRWGHGPAVKLRRLWEGLFQSAGVDVVLSGHDHFYQKIRPQGGIHYFVSGGGGKVRKGMKRDHPQVEFGKATLHFIAFEVTRGEVRFQAIDDTGTVIHEGRIEHTP